MLEPSKELKDRVESKRHLIESRISELKADSRNNAREQILQLQSKLDDMQNIVSMGWEHLTDKAVLKINEWLKD